MGLFSLTDSDLTTLVESLGWNPPKECEGSLEEKKRKIKFTFISTW